MRYAQGGGLTPREQARRERVRLEAGERFAAGVGTAQVARELRVTERSVRRWRRAWRAGGAEGLRSQGPVSIEKLSPRQFARLEAELGRGPGACGFPDDQRWTLKRIKKLVGRLFHIGYTEEGVWRLMRRHGWSCQVPVRRAAERDEEAIELWKDRVWPQVKPPPTTWAPTSASRTSRGRG